MIIKPIVFLTFSSPSASLDLKVPNNNDNDDDAQDDKNDKPDGSDDNNDADNENDNDGSGDASMMVMTNRNND